MAGNYDDPVRLDHYQNIIEVGWSNPSYADYRAVRKLVAPLAGPINDNSTIGWDTCSSAGTIEEWLAAFSPGLSWAYLKTGYTIDATSAFDPIEVAYPQVDGGGAITGWGDYEAIDESAIEDLTTYGKGNWGTENFGDWELVARQWNGAEPSFRANSSANSLTQFIAPAGSGLTNIGGEYGSYFRDETTIKCSWWGAGYTGGNVCWTNRLSDQIPPVAGSFLQWRGCETGASIVSATPHEWPGGGFALVENAGTPDEIRFNSIVGVWAETTFKGTYMTLLLEPGVTA